VPGAVPRTYNGGHLRPFEAHMLPIARVLFVAACGLIGGCHAGARTDRDAVAGDQPHHCREAADCAVKNVGNCCGYHPACVHRDQPVDPDAVMARCEKEGTASICGFAEISGCACVAQRCVPADDGDPR
jgi:hypothetical protein